MLKVYISQWVWVCECIHDLLVIFLCVYTLFLQLDYKLRLFFSLPFEATNGSKQILINKLAYLG